MERPLLFACPRFSPALAFRLLLLFACSCFSLASCASAASESILELRTHAQALFQAIARKHRT